MKSKPTKPTRSTGYKHLVRAISQLSTQMQRRVATVANQALVLRNWMVGAYIVEFEQGGADRAKYGQKLLAQLASDLTIKGVKGLDERALRDCRSAYFIYSQIRGTLSPELTATLVLPSMAAVAEADSVVLSASIRGTASPELPTPLSCDCVMQLSWSKLQELIRISDPWKRAFYENQALSEDWSVRDLQRQIESLLYERTGLSTNKKTDWFKDRMMRDDENPPVGIILCTDKDHTDVEFATAGIDQKLFVSRYLTALPSADELKALVEADQAQLQARKLK